MRFQIIISECGISKWFTGNRAIRIRTRDDKLLSHTRKVFPVEEQFKVYLGKVNYDLFYLECDDMDRQKKVIQFFLDNDMIQKTKSGRLYNISFKLDDQTRAGEYGESYNGNIKLVQFLDLQTGEWLE